MHRFLTSFAQQGAHLLDWNVAVAEVHAVDVFEVSLPFLNAYQGGILSSVQSNPAKRIIKNFFNYF